MDTEVWKDISGYEGLYQVSNLGNIKSLNYNRKGFSKNMKLCVDNKGYLFTFICKNGIRKKISVHRTVAIEFIIRITYNNIVMHIDNNPTNNNINNLKWGTLSENTKQMWDEGRANNSFQKKHPMKGKFGKKHNKSIKIIQYSLSGEFIRKWDCQLEVKRELGINNGGISDCCRGKLRTSGGYIWAYDQT